LTFINTLAENDIKCIIIYENLVYSSNEILWPQILAFIDLQSDTEIGVTFGRRSDFIKRCDYVVIDGVVFRPLSTRLGGGDTDGQNLPWLFII